MLVFFLGGISFSFKGYENNGVKASTLMELAGISATTFRSSERVSLAGEGPKLLQISFHQISRIKTTFSPLKTHIALFWKMFQSLMNLKYLTPKKYNYWKNISLQETNISHHGKVGRSSNQKCQTGWDINLSSQEGN